MNPGERSYARRSDMRCYPSQTRGASLQEEDELGGGVYGGCVEREQRLELGQPGARSVLSHGGIETKGGEGNKKGHCRLRRRRLASKAGLCTRVSSQQERPGGTAEGARGVKKDSGADRMGRAGTGQDVPLAELGPGPARRHEGTASASRGAHGGPW